ncbi:MAG TPA: phospholipase D-like domain-containing protein [Solirubrobacterales bacterium]
MGGEGSLIQYARDDLLAQIRRSRERVWLVAPFLSGAVAEKISAAGEDSSASDLRLLTALTERSVRSRVLDPKGLRCLHEAGFKVADRKDLHAKVSVVDGWGLVGSGNLTNSGLGGDGRANVELGVILSAAQVGDAAELVEHWWKSATEKTVAEIAKYERLKPYPPAETTLDDVDEPVGVIGTERLREILEEDAGDAGERSYWIDPNYHDYHQEWWWRRGWVSDRREAGIKENDLLVIYLGKHEGGPGKCPAVGRALGPPRHDSDFIANQGDVDAVERWPWVTDLDIVADVPADDGVGLEVIGKDGRSTQSGPIHITRAQFEELASRLV